ncbi:hypothetical protein EYF80_010005 [Liparis tanakae]|uniref:Uncharacterized protein n=1 Tax=Liparis tanakae TaxID=230148 RepID=A0A4Z2IPM9_9TELE|nr:hypothetical protein EYF80_010005 [Liparis tanakae]
MAAMFVLLLNRQCQGLGFVDWIGKADCGGLGMAGLSTLSEVSEEPTATSSSSQAAVDTQPAHVPLNTASQSHLSHRRAPLMPSDAADSRSREAGCHGKPDSYSLLRHRVASLFCFRESDRKPLITMMDTLKKQACLWQVTRQWMHWPLYTSTKKKTVLDQAEERAVRTRCVASCGLLALEGREDLDKKKNTERAIPRAARLPWVFRESTQPRQSPFYSVVVVMVLVYSQKRPHVEEGVLTQESPICPVVELSNLASVQSMTGEEGRVGLDLVGDVGFWEELSGLVAVSAKDHILGLLLDGRGKLPTRSGDSTRVVLLLLPSEFSLLPGRTESVLFDLSKASWACRAKARLFSELSNSPPAPTLPLWSLLPSVTLFSFLSLLLALANHVETCVSVILVMMASMIFSPLVGYGFFLCSLSQAFKVLVLSRVAFLGLAGSPYWNCPYG